VHNRTEGWAREFEDPIILADSRMLRAVLDALNYIEALSRKETKATELHPAVEALVPVAENGGPTPTDLAASAACPARVQPHLLPKPGGSTLSTSQSKNS
jgi:hypothetical protein